MSILYDALQKAKKQQERMGPAKNVSPSTKDVLEQFQKIEDPQEQAVEFIRRKKPSNTSLMALIAMALISFIFAAAFFFYLSQRFSTPIRELQKSKEPKPAAEIAPPASPAPAAAAPVKSLSLDTGRSSDPRTTILTASPQAVNVVAPVTPKVRNVMVEKIAPVEPIELKIPDFRVTGILGDRDGKYCFLNGLIARVGDRIDGARVLKIGTRGVLLDYQGTQLEVPLPEI